MEILRALSEAFGLLLTGDQALYEIIFLSLQVNLSAVALAALIGFPLGALLATSRFIGRGFINTMVNTLMGLPPVVVGLVVYMMISRSGPLGVLELLYTPTAMIIAQLILVTPIITALTRQSLSRLNDDYQPMFFMLGLSPWRRMRTLIYDGGMDLVTALLAGLGRAMAEVGAVMIVGGNINHFTRVMTTTITLETSRGHLSTALALGAVLLTMTLIINALVAILSGGR
ncbi:MAG: ABC transporter permease [Alphaproteobacteria bacterium]|jgi:tungstate transport system permease protein|nr:ABC transporter permease [Alphaproteobacteria bacterium]MDA8675760.1 ABC transporter permease [Alphaproteobacteria bacterium]MDG2466871.1 ABC transporter permease [Alphaproteobacteria bacterium]